MPALGENKDFEPFNDYVLLKQIKRGETESGLALPDEADYDAPIGKVMRAGPGGVGEDGERLPMPCQVGDIVYFLSPRYRPAVEVEIDHETYLLMRAVDTMGRIVIKAA